MALKRTVRIEDIVIGMFVVAALFYPVIVTLLISYQDREETPDEIEVLRATYLFVAGFDTCSSERALQLARFMDRKLLSDLGGVAGLVKLCRENGRTLGGGVVLREVVERKNSRVYLSAFIRTTEGRSLELRVYGRTREEGFRIEGIEYAERS